MKQDMEARAAALARYIIENRTTVRAAAKKFGVSKSTVHMEVRKQNGFMGSTIRQPGEAGKERAGSTVGKAANRKRV